MELKNGVNQVFLFHPIKIRIQSGVGQPAKELLELEQALYSELRAFVVETPSASVKVANNGLTLIIGGVRA